MSKLLYLRDPITFNQSQKTQFTDEHSEIEDILFAPTANRARVYTADGRQINIPRENVAGFVEEVEE